MDYNRRIEKIENKVRPGKDAPCYILVNYIGSPPQSVFVVDGQGNNEEMSIEDYHAKFPAERTTVKTVGIDLSRI
jgi:hypothetical protein